MTAVLKFPFRLLWVILKLSASVLRYAGTVALWLLTVVIWPALRHGVPAALRGIRRGARWLWPKLIVGIVLICSGLAWTWAAIRRRFSSSPSRPRAP